MTTFFYWQLTALKKLKTEKKLEVWLTKILIFNWQPTNIYAKSWLTIDSWFPPSYRERLEFPGLTWFGQKILHSKVILKKREGSKEMECGKNWRRRRKRQNERKKKERGKESKKEGRKPWNEGKEERMRGKEKKYLERQDTGQWPNHPTIWESVLKFFTQWKSIKSYIISIRCICLEIIAYRCLINLSVKSVNGI